LSTFEAEPSDHLGWDFGGEKSTTDIEFTVVRSLAEERNTDIFLSSLIPGKKKYHRHSCGEEQFQ
jgi:hypothetical protein